MISSLKTFRVLYCRDGNHLAEYFGGYSVPFHGLFPFLVRSKVEYTVSVQYRIFNGYRYSGESAQFAAILFGIHPLNSESFANNVGRAEVLSAHFMMSAIINREATATSGMYALLGE